MQSIRTEPETMKVLESLTPAQRGLLLLRARLGPNVTLPAIPEPQTPATQRRAAVKVALCKAHQPDDGPSSKQSSGTWTGGCGRPSRVWTSAGRP